MIRDPKLKKSPGAGSATLMFLFCNVMWFFTHYGQFNLTIQIKGIYSWTLCFCKLFLCEAMNGCSGCPRSRQEPIPRVEDRFLRLKNSLVKSRGFCGFVIFISYFELFFNINAVLYRWCTKQRLAPSRHNVEYVHVFGIFIDWIPVSAYLVRRRNPK